MIAIVDYGVGNLFSLRSSLASIGADAIVTGDPELLHKADKIILPGVGAFGDAAAKLRENGLDQVVIEEAHSGKPLMGICLGMQLLFDSGEEYGIHQGLGLIPGRVVSMKGVVPEDYKIPHIGWNALIFPEGRGGKAAGGAVDIAAGGSAGGSAGGAAGGAAGGSAGGAADGAAGGSAGGAVDIAAGEDAGAQTGEKSPLFKYINDGDCVYFVHSFYATDCAESVIADAEYGALLTAAVQNGNVYGCQFHPEKSGNVGLNILKAFCEL